METIYGRIINKKLYRVDKIIIEERKIVSNPTPKLLEKFGYKRIEILEDDTLDRDYMVEDDKIIYTNKNLCELKNIIESPINKLNNINNLFMTTMKNIIDEFNVNVSNYQDLYNSTLKTYCFSCDNKNFNNFVVWLEEEYGERWFETFDIDVFLKNNDLETNKFFIEFDIPFSERLPIVSGIHKLQFYLNKKEKNVVLTALYVLAHTKFDAFVTKMLKIFLEEYTITQKKELSRLSLEEKMQILQARITFSYENFLPIHCRRNSIVHDNGILIEWRYNKFKEKCTLPFHIGENITPSIEDVLKEIKIMGNLLKEICEKTIEELKK